MRKNILITGMPRSGKSTLIKTITQQLGPVIGFVTNEVRKNGERIGFEIETNAGEKSMFADVNFKTNFRVSKYSVDIDNLNLVIPKVESFKSDDLLFLDEIGQMQLFSDKFKSLVKKYFDSSNICIATLSKVYSDEFIEDIKKRNDIILFEITEENREEIEKYLKALLRKVLKARRYASEPDRFSINQNNVNIRTDHGTRLLTRQKEEWMCNCEFFKENKVCSHVIALEEYMKTYE